MLGRVLNSILMFVFLLPASAWAQEAVEAAAEHAEEGGSSMPQLDPTYYASQLFWLAVSGIILYVLLARVAIPRASKMVDLRDAQVQHDLEQAYKLKQQAENLKIKYTRALRDADEKAATLVTDTLKELKDRQSAAIEAGLEKVNEQVGAAETSLRKEKNAVLDNLKPIADKLSKTIADKVAKRA